MLKYFRKQKNNCHNKAINETDGDDVMDNIFNNEADCHQHGESHSVKTRYLRTTSTFCDELFLDEILKATSPFEPSHVNLSENEDAINCGALSLHARKTDDVGSMPHNVTIVGSDKDLFKYHSRLSMSISSIINEPTCLSYFIQYLEKKETALPLIKFYLDTENFRNAALNEIKKEQKTCDPIHGNKLDKSDSEECCTYVPELKTLCDYVMRKSITDDEKSQIYEEANKKLCLKVKEGCILSTINLSNSLSSNQCLEEYTYDATQLCEKSVQDALTIYQKYLIYKASCYIEIPVDILSKISLILCKKSVDGDNHHQPTNDHFTIFITADCFREAQCFVLEQLERDYLMEFLQSTYYSKYCLELVESNTITIYDILYSEITLFYFMEYLEQQNERHCLDFWSAAINYRKEYVSKINDRVNTNNVCVARADAMIIYEKFFSLQSNNTLWVSSKLRAYVESTICSDEWIIYCFDLPLKVVATYMERKFFNSFLKSPLFSNYINELKLRTNRKDEHEHNSVKTSPPSLLNKHKISLRRCYSEKSNRSHRKTLSDCTHDKRHSFISQQNTLLASVDNPSLGCFKQFELDIDTNQLNDPQLLWHRSGSVNYTHSSINNTSASNTGSSNSLRFGRVNPFGRYERDFTLPGDVFNRHSLKGRNNWSIPLNGYNFTKVMRKLAHLPEDNVQEEIAWQVAEMIVKDITNVTMNGKNTISSTTTTTAVAETTTKNENVI